MLAAETLINIKTTEKRWQLLVINCAEALFKNVISFKGRSFLKWSPFYI